MSKGTAVIVNSDAEVKAVGPELSIYIDEMRKLKKDSSVVCVNTDGTAWCEYEWYYKEKYEIISFFEWQERQKPVPVKKTGPEGEGREDEEERK